ncbi:MAG TPA: helix-turn-helix transcriptional regulator [Bdellovibrio sp.]|nr:helix-turn-helix transcriptional regulator [Bdellovibrio sp.]
MRMSKRTKELAANLNLNDAEAAVMELKFQLYQQASKSILKSKLTHEDIAKKIGTSRARITRIANLGENSLSIELLIKIITTLEHRMPLKVA